MTNGGKRCNLYLNSIPSEMRAAQRAARNTLPRKSIRATKFLDITFSRCGQKGHQQQSSTQLDAYIYKNICLFKSKDHIFDVANNYRCSLEGPPVTTLSVYTLTKKTNEWPTQSAAADSLYIYLYCDPGKELSDPTGSIICYSNPESLFLLNSVFGLIYVNRKIEISLVLNFYRN